MILTASKLSTQMLCWRKALNAHLRGYVGEPSYGLVKGSAYHSGLATGIATKDWTQAKLDARATFQKEVSMKTELPGDEWLREDHIDLVMAMLEVYEQNWATAEYTVVQPECKFDVEIPKTYHPDILCHWIEDDEERWNFWGLVDNPRDARDAGYAILEDNKLRAPKLLEVKEDGTKVFEASVNAIGWKEDKMDVELMLQGKVRSPHTYFSTRYLDRNEWFDRIPTDCLCFQHHRLRGITDAIVTWKNFLWLIEHKSTTELGDIFWSEFHLDVQPTAYLYGVWKATGLLPKGVIVNAMYKPSDRQVQSWNSRRKSGGIGKVSDYIRFEREPITRTEQDLLRFEREAKEWGDEFERRVISGRFPMSNTRGICTMWRKLCEYHPLCLSHDSPEQLETFEQQRLIQIDKRREVGAKW